MANGSATRARPALPGLCAICRGWSGTGFCAPCIQQFAPPRPRCACCGRPTAQALPRCGACLREAPVIDRTIALADYRPPWPTLIGGFKFRQQVELAGALAQALAQAVQSGGPPWPALVVPVPLSAARLRERGYNQAWEIARRLARHLGLKASAGVLHRVRDTAHQVGMTRDQRAANLRDAFWVDPRSVRQLAGAHVALVDDVVTTGATANAAAQALRRAGAAAVDLWVVARTPLDDD